MATYEIKNYIKLLCIRVDHFESFLVDEKNTDSIEEIEKFIEQYDNHEGLKIVIIQMGNMEMITFDDVVEVLDGRRKLMTETLMSHVHRLKTDCLQ